MNTTAINFHDDLYPRISIDSRREAMICHHEECTPSQYQYTDTATKQLQALGPLMGLPDNAEIFSAAQHDFRGNGRKPTGGRATIFSRLFQFSDKRKTKQLTSNRLDKFSRKLREPDIFPLVVVRRRNRAIMAWEEPRKTGMAYRRLGKARPPQRPETSTSELMKHRKLGVARVSAWSGWLAHVCILNAMETPRGGRRWSLRMLISETGSVGNSRTVREWIARGA